jgi:predicted GNAT superfamily acetyltransferase
VTAEGVRATVRPLVRYDELRACVAFQHRIWGDDFAEVVPAAILWVAHRTGGVIAGAFDDANNMLGFVFGLSGFRDGEPIHWSDMLAVREDLRGTGIGQLLKQYQRDTLLAAGIRHVGWTFDPLESRNAWLNFARLGATSREYVVDCYGESTSPLHEGIGTDRLIARWILDSARVRQRMEGETPPATPPADARWINEQPDRPDLELDARHLLLRIPADIQALKAADPEAGHLWRARTRPVFTTYLARGYEVRELFRESVEWSVYLLSSDA